MRAGQLFTIWIDVGRTTHIQPKQNVDDLISLLISTFRQFDSASPIDINKKGLSIVQRFEFELDGLAKQREVYWRGVCATLGHADHFIRTLLSEHFHAL